MRPTMVVLTTIANLGDEYPRASTCSIGQLENGQQLPDTSNPLLLRCRAISFGLRRKTTLHVLLLHVGAPARWVIKSTFFLGFF